MDDWGDLSDDDGGDDDDDDDELEGQDIYQAVDDESDESSE